MRRKLDVVKSMRSREEKAGAVIKFDVGEQTQGLIDVKKSIDSLYELINDKEEYDFDKLSNQLKVLNETLDLREQLGLLKKELELTNKQQVTVEHFTKLIDAVGKNKPVDIDLTVLEKAIVQIQQRIQESSVLEQAPEDYAPFRRVVKLGNRLVFDDQPTPAGRASGGGSSGGGSSSVAVTSSVLPDGAATSANQATVISHVDDIEGLLTTIDSDTSDLVNVFGTDTVRSGNAIGISNAKISLQSEFESATGWVESTAADNLATTTQHRGIGVNFLTFDKIIGDTTAFISKTLSSFDASAYGSAAWCMMWVYLPSLTNVSNVFARMGTDSSNYMQWDFSVTELAVGWNQLQASISTPTSQTGDGYNLAAVSYIAVGCTFDGAGNTLTGIIVGGATLIRTVEFPTGVETVVTSANVNVLKIGGSPIDKDAGNASVGSQRVVIATDDINLAAIKTGVETLDNIVSGNEAQVDVVTMPQPTPPSAIVAFATDIPNAGTRVQLGSNVVNGVVIQAKSTNTGVIYVGGSDVSSTVFGAELQPGQSVGLAIDNTNKIYVDTATNGNDVAVLGS